MNKISSYLRRLRKERPDQWVGRMAVARKRLWGRLFSNPPSEARLARAERAMARLCALEVPWQRWDHHIVSWLLTPISLFPSRRLSYKGVDRDASSVAAAQPFKAY